MQLLLVDYKSWRMRVLNCYKGQLGNTSVTHSLLFVFPGKEALHSNQQ